MPSRMEGIALAPEEGNLGNESVGSSNTLYLDCPDLHEHGWSVDEDGIVAVTWDTSESLTPVQELID